VIALLKISLKDLDLLNEQAPLLENLDIVDLVENSTFHSEAEMKDRYLQLIIEAGLQEIKVIEESSFPIENRVNDPSIQTITKTPEISPRKVRELVNAVVSVKVSGIKPSS
jgi:hypothetical protein